MTPFAGNQVRFFAVDGEGKVVATSAWMPERINTDAPNALAAFRRQFPKDEYRYMIERRGDNKNPNPVKQIRFQIKQGEEIRYSRLIQEHEKDEVLAQIREMFKGAEITEVQTNG